MTDAPLPDWLCEGDAAVRLSVHVVPRAKKDEIVGTHAGALKIRLAAPPVGGAANSALIGFLADCLHVRKRDVVILRGHSSRRKLVRVEDVTADHALARIEPFLT